MSGSQPTELPEVLVTAKRDPPVLPAQRVPWLSHKRIDGHRRKPEGEPL